MKQRVKEMEDEAAKLREMQAEVEKSMNPEEGESHILQLKDIKKRTKKQGFWQKDGEHKKTDKEAVDARSVYVGNVKKKRGWWKVHDVYIRSY